MILSICVNPAIDYYVETEGFKAGALNAIQNKRIMCGGKGVNFALAAKHLGFDCVAGGFMGRNKAAFEKLLASLSIGYKFIDCDGEIRTNIKILSGDGMITELNEKGFEVPETAQAELLKLADETDIDMLICCGSTSPGMKEDYYYRLANAAGPKVKFACDCEKSALISSLRANPFLIKPNRYELETVFATELKTYADIIKAARMLVSKGAQNVLVSLGKSGAIIVNGSSAFYAQYTQNIEILNQCGSGDAMFAAACDIYNKGGNLIEMLTAGVVMGTLAVNSRSLASPDMGKAAEIRKNVKVEAIS